MIKQLLISFILTLFAQESSAQCDSYLRLRSAYSFDEGRGYIEIGDLDVEGNQLTVEAVFNAEGNYNTYAQGGNLVSKHCSANDVNYLLRPYSAQITTDQGFFSVNIPCEYERYKTYHIAMVYNGSTLSIYRNGQLMNQVAAYGNLITNNWTTKIGTEGCNAISSVDFQGYINHVRIWNVARSQSAIQSYMMQNLPNPSTQFGLKAYYIFNSLQNLQGNSTWNGIIHGSTSSSTNSAPAMLSQYNPTCSDFTTFQCSTTSDELNCQNYLHVQSTKSGVTLGDLDITGTALTLEAVFMRTTSYDPIGQGGDLLSKHTDTKSGFYLRPNGGMISTSNGCFRVNAPCAAELNSSYHIAMVYDGKRLKLYRNEELIDDQPATGTLITNNLPLNIGTEGDYMTTTLPIHFIGYINEVRIWNTARRAEEIASYSSRHLPFPYTNSNLIAYYIFDNLQNKKGNGQWNGQLISNGNSTYNQTPPDCSLGSPCQYYPRISKSKDFDELELNRTQNFLEIFPNPSKGEVFINLYSEKNEKASVVILNTLGEKHSSQQINVTQGSNRIKLKGLEYLNKGNYFVQLNLNNKIITKKLIVY